MARGDVWYRMSTTGQKIAWLLTNYRLWADKDVTLDPIRREIVEKMRADKLISNTTYWRDVNIVGLVKEARKIRGKKHDTIRSQR